jgi:uncharacterized protein GlcG (DUF336 family)
MKLKNALLGITLAGFSLAAAAQDRPPYGPDVKLDQAKKMAVSALAEAQRNKWRVAIAIVDNHGFLVYYEKMDDTQTGSPQIAIDKAKTAAMLRRPTKAVEDGITKGRVALMSIAPGPLEGGIPIMLGGRIIGGIGVSGVNSDQDAQVAQAGLNALK